MAGHPWPEDRLKPCGTPAAARRHWRRGERACEACLRASRNDSGTRKGYGEPGAKSIDAREIRNGLPVFRPYIYRGLGYDQLTGDVA